MTRNVAVDGAGVYVLKGTVLRIAGSRFSHNIAAGSGGAVGVTDTGTLVCDGCTFVSNFASGDGGAVAVDGVKFLGLVANVTLHRSYLGANNAAGNGGGAAVTGESILSVLWCTFMGNHAAKTGGGVSQVGPTAFLRVTQTGFDANSATNPDDPTSGLGGALAIDSITATQLLDGITISHGAARVGAGIWWKFLGNATAKTTRRVGGPCVSCRYLNNTGSNVATQQWNATLTSSPLPSYVFQAGVPVETGTPGYVVTLVDVYGQPSLADYSSTCSISPLNPSLTVVQGNAILAVGGVAAFRGLSMLGPTGTPFGVQVSCDIANYGTTVTRGNFIVAVVTVTLGVCHPGSALTVAQFCALCLAGTYSIAGTYCASCPPDASCPTAGVVYPVSNAGYYLSRVSSATLSDICSDFEYDRGPCAPGLYVNQRGTSQQTCQPDVSLYTPDQIYSCTSKFQLYACQTPVACNAGVTQLNISGEVGTHASSVGCATGYGGVLCALCDEGYTKNSDMTCRLARAFVCLCLMWCFVFCVFVCMRASLNECVMCGRVVHAAGTCIRRRRQRPKHTTWFQDSSPLALSSSG